MTKKKKSRLGKGLGALLGDVKQTTNVAQPGAAQPDVVRPGVVQPDVDSDDRPPLAGGAVSELASDQQTSVAAAPSTGASGLWELPIELLQRGKYQPRLNIDKEALEELSESIRAQGIIQPLLVRQLAADKYEIIAGERRWRGAQLAGLATVPSVIREISDETAMAVALIENIQRQDLNAIEQALGFQRLLDEFGLTHEEIAESVGRSRTAVTNTLRLLTLQPAVRKMVESGELDMGHARALLGLAEQRQHEAARKVVKGGLSVRATEHLVKRLNRAKPVSKVSPGEQRDVRHLEEELSTRIGARVEILHGSKKGKLVIHYHSLDELDGILGRIK